MLIKVEILSILHVVIGAILWFFCILCSPLCSCCCLFYCTSGCCCLFWLRVKKRYDKLNRLRHLRVIQFDPPPRQDTIEMIEFDSNLFDIEEMDLDFREVISSSAATAVVYRARYRGGENVTFKAFRSGVISTQDKYDDFEREVKLLSRLKHAALLHFYGCYLKAPRVGIVQEYCRNGDIRRYLSGENAKNPNLPLSERLRILREVSDVMTFLNKEGVIHKNLKAENILLSKKLHAKLIDFGLSQVVSGYNYFGKMSGRNHYVAPEVTLSSSYTNKCDVFSFAVLMYEIVTNDFHPFGDPEFNLELRVALNPDFRPPIEEKAVFAVKSMEWLIRLMNRCWDVDVSARPEFEEIRHIIDKEMLTTISNLEEVQEYFWVHREERAIDFITSYLPENEKRNLEDNLGVVNGEDYESSLDIDDAEIDEVMDDIFGD